MSAKTLDVDICKEISQGHEVMSSVLRGRLMKLKVAKTMAGKQSGCNQLVNYLHKCNDDSLTADILPFLKKQVCICFKIKIFISRVYLDKTNVLTIFFCTFLLFFTYCFNLRSKVIFGNF